MLKGRFENTAFCLLSPDGKERLSRSGRAPEHAFAARGRHATSAETAGVTVAAMEKVARGYTPRGNFSETVLQDFHSFRQALNVASGDQRLLLFVDAPANQLEEIRATLRPVMADEDIVGRFHVDVFNRGDEQWSAAISDAEPSFGPSIYIIQSDKFGQSGTALKQLPVNTSGDQIKLALLSANKRFAREEQRKIYSQHVSDGRRLGIYFEGGVEYGEDRDADGKIDNPRRRN